MLLSSLCRANMGILSQKVILIEALTSRHGLERAKDLYKSACPLVGASIGQHIRHSMDHMELAVLVAATIGDSVEAAELHYDQRVRGGTLEHDMDEAKKRILNVSEALHDLSARFAPKISDAVVLHPVKANFLLSADQSIEFGLDSSVGRELGFAAHHAIHHMALIKLIAVNHAGLKEGDLPPDFGRAPSTVKHDRAVKSEIHL